MKRLHVSLLGSKTVMQAARSLMFTCVLRCHTRSPKVKGQNLLIYNSVAEIYFPACWLDNKNLHQLLYPGHLPTSALPKSLSQIFLWVEFFRRAPIPIVNPLQCTVCICWMVMEFILLFEFSLILQYWFQNLPLPLVLTC